MSTDAAIVSHPEQEPDRYAEWKHDWGRLHRMSHELSEDRS
jgi:hypothetical protein